MEIEKYIDSCIAFLEKEGAHLMILIEKKEEFNASTHPLILEIFKANLVHKIEFRCVPERFQHLYDYHLMVADSRSYRMEKGKNKEAIAQFHENDLSLILDCRFNELWRISDEIII